MMLAAWPQVGAADELQLWIGIFGSEQPPMPTFEIGGQAALPIGTPQLNPIRDRQTGPRGLPLNHQGVFRLAARGPDRPHLVAVRAGGDRIERIVHSLPSAVPAKLDGTFNLLLASCYFQPEDSGGMLGNIVAQLPIRPHMTLLAGDQVYLDLPLFEDLPESEPALSQFLGDKYRRNWLSETLGIAGLHALLTRAPALCIPDDHEFWNNYPFKQAQLPGTWAEDGRTRWCAAAQSLYEDYQQGGPPGSAASSWRIDIDPLRMLILDTRCRRGGDFAAAAGLMASEAKAALLAWETDLAAALAAGKPVIGLLAAGQALFVDLPEDSAARWKDAELANYEEFDRVEGALERLATAGVPVIFLTGDVHWGRIAEAVHMPSGRAMLYEVICSPSRLIDTPGTDQLALVGNSLRGIFGRAETWPRHPEPPNPPSRFGRGRQFTPIKVFHRRGDQVALVQFSRAGRGLEMQVSYHAIHADPEVAQPETAGPFPLLPY